MLFHKFDKTMKEVQQDLRTRDDIQLLDVREMDEYLSGHIPGAVLLPLSELEESAQAIIKKDKDIYVYCRSGQRSAAACRKLKHMGYHRVFNIGGIIQWPFAIEEGKK